MKNLLRFLLGASFYLFAYACMVLAVGSLIGGLGYMLVGAFTHPELSIAQRFLDGIWAGFRFAGIWAIGLAIVLTLIQWRHMHQKPANKY